MQRCTSVRISIRYGAITITTTTKTSEEIVIRMCRIAQWTCTGTLVERKYSHIIHFLAFLVDKRATTTTTMATTIEYTVVQWCEQQNIISPHRLTSYQRITTELLISMKTNTTRPVDQRGMWWSIAATNCTPTRSVGQDYKQTPSDDCRCIRAKQQSKWYQEMCQRMWVLSLLIRND